ncbi:MAG TPA: 1-phosphofructokinase family hexose kinase [Trinickia sp.]|uniref:1-phosphofructokinase family hexose kinase n=1 Tax=Trinickia sp. TaxID=2571163 RepID=UPI002F420F91
MPRIVTLTLNPALDVSTAVEQVIDTRKLRCDTALRHPGGGGINVARVIERLGGDCVAVYLAGGPFGEELRRLVEAENVCGQCIEIVGETRESFSVYEKSTGRQFRFVLPGPTLAEAEWRGCIARLDAFDPPPSYLVLSGSLPPGVPDDIYARLARSARSKGTRVVLDTSGPALRSALDAGVFLVKPSLGELRELTGRPLADESEWKEAALALVHAGQAHTVVLTLGGLGALLVSERAVLRAPALSVPVASAIGAGDSFLGALVWALDRDAPLEDAFRYGLAAACASLLNAGTELCKKEDIERLYRDIVIG